MDVKKIQSSSDEESIGSDEDDQDKEVNNTYGNKIIDNDSLLDSSDSSESESESAEVESSEYMDVDESVVNEQLAKINDQLAENPYAYDLYVEKIKIMQQIGDLDKLRETREKFSQMYPLSEQIWLNWLRDEIKLAFTDEEKEDVEKLFERAIGDYLSVELWLEYINFCISNMKDGGGQEKCRDVFERALGSCGLHVSMGSLVWDMYRDFEAALLGTATTEEQLQAQESRFIALCRRQLSVPLLGMSKTYEDMKTKIDVNENTENGFKKAVLRLATLETWESKLIAPHEDKLSIYREYIEDEKKVKGNPARIQCLYERAVAEFPLDSSMWLEYIEYLSKNLKIEKIVLSVAERASRNCSWDINVWLKYMNMAELFCEPPKTFDTVKSIFEKAVLYCGTGEAVGTVWLKYLEFLRRRVDLSHPSEKEVEILKKSFDAAEQHLLQHYPEPNEFIGEILLFRARFEAQCGQMVSETVGNLWKDIISRGYGQYAKTWLQLIMQEVSTGADVRKMRSHYNKAISYVQDDIQTLSSLWINFERDNGDLSSLQQCESKISSQLAKISSISYSVDDQQQPKTTASRSFLRTTDVTIAKGVKRKIDEEASSSTKRGRKNEDTVDSDKTNSVFKVPFVPAGKNETKVDRQVPKSRHGETVKHDSSKDNRTVFLSNLAFTTSEAEIRDFFKEFESIEVRLAKDFRGRSKGFGYVCFKKEIDAKTALGKDRQLLQGRPAFVSKCDPDKTTRQTQFKYPSHLEKNKLFVKGLPLSFTADELRDFFEKHGDLKDCRLVTYRNGHSKGLAFVEYIDEACAKEALLKTDGTMIGESKLSVAISNPPPRDVTKSSGSSGSMKSLEPQQRRAPKAFVPRALQINTTMKNGQNNDGEKFTAPKSNQDFRSLFLK